MLYRHYSVFILLLILFCSCSSENKKNESQDLYNKGKESFLNRDLNSSENYFKKSIELDSNFLNAHLMLAKTYFYKKDERSAINEIDYILKKDNDHINALYWKSKLLIYSNSNNESNEKTIENNLLKIIEIDPSHMGARALLALLYEKNEKYKEALYQYQNILDEEKSLIDSRANLSILYKKMGFDEKAKNEITRAIEIASKTNITTTNLSLLQKEIENEGKK